MMMVNVIKDKSKLEIVKNVVPKNVFSGATFYILCVKNSQRAWMQNPFRIDRTTMILLDIISMGNAIGLFLNN